MKIKHVFGNVLKLDIPLTVKIVSVDGGQTEEREEPFYPSNDWPVVVNFVSAKNTFSFEAEMEGNVAKVVDDGTIPVGMYDVECLCHDDNGEPYRYYCRQALDIVFATKDAGIVAGVEFDVETHILEGAVFVSYGGDFEQVQADFAETDPTSKAYIKNKPVIPSPVYESTVAGWGFTKNTGTYSKPSTGIPKADLAQDVQASLGKADTALQSFTETDPTVPSWAKQAAKPTYTAQEVGALPADTLIPSELSELSEDSSHRTVTDVEKARWEGKSDFSGSYNDLTDKPTIPTVPTNVSAFNNDVGYLTQHQSLSGYATEAWVQQQGYLTQHQDISGKEDKVAVVSASGTALAAEVGKYYKFGSAVGTLAVTLPSVSDATKVSTVVFGFTTGSSPAVTFTPPNGVPIYFSDGFSIEASSSYEVNALFNGTAWCLALIKLIESV